MSYDRDVRFSEKKIDESWKDQVDRDRGPGQEVKPAPSAAGSAPKPVPSETKTKAESSPQFLGLLNSLAYQALYQLGEVAGPDGQPVPPDLTGAQEVIDLLRSLQEKTKGNLSAEESRFFDAIVPELQMKFVAKS